MAAQSSTIELMAGTGGRWWSMDGGRGLLTEEGDVGRWQRARRQTLTEQLGWADGWRGCALRRRSVGVSSWQPDESSVSSEMERALSGRRWMERRGLYCAAACSSESAAVKKPEGATYLGGQSGDGDGARPMIFPGGAWSGLFLTAHSLDWTAAGGRGRRSASERVGVGGRG